MTRGLIFSQMVLLTLIDKGMSRENAYAVVQRSAMKSWLEGLEFRTLLTEDHEVMSFLTDGDLDGVFRVENFLTKVDFIFERVFGDQA